MATLTPAQLELASSLTQDELPTKLRCAICSKLAVNAFRLPCCETAICENCQAVLPSSCPVCEHTPVSGADCTVYKSLRTTIRVFLKTEEKKREAAKPKIDPSAPTTPTQETESTPAPTQTQGPVDAPAVELSAPDSINSEHPLDEATVPVASSFVETENNRAGELINGQFDSEQANGHPPDESLAEVEEVEGSGPQGHVTEETAGNDGEKGDAVAEASADQSEQSGMNFGFDPMNNNFNMSFGNGDMTQMQMMMAMQNGMNPAAFGSFPMMGMMDPMMMQNMLMNGGFGAQGMGMNGMGMSGMNMNMGMNGFNGGSDDWNGQQSWNVGQDNFNPNAPGMGNGDFGNFNANFRAGNYGHHNQFNDYRRGGYGFRGRGRGRGYFSGYGRGYHHNFGQQGNWAEGQSNSPSQAIDTASGNVDEFGRTIRPDQSQDGQPVGQDEQNAASQYRGDNTASGAPDQVAKELVPGFEDTPGDNTKPDGDVASVHQQSNGPEQFDLAPQPRAAPSVPLNAPTGPKAMRQGLPNTSLFHLRARGYIMDEKTPSIGANGPVVASPVELRPESRSSSLQSHKDRRQPDRPEERDSDEKSRAKDHDRGHGRSRTHSLSRSRSPSRSRSRSPDRKESRRHKRHRSPSASNDSRDGDHRRRKHKTKRHSTREDDDHNSRSKGDRHEEPSQSVSPADREHKRSNHRSHRERDRDRDRERDRERDRDRDRDRERDRERDRDRNRDRDRDRDDKRRERDKERGRDSDLDRHRKPSHRSSHRERDDDRERDREREKDRERPREKERSRDVAKEHRNHDGKQSTVNPPSTEKGFNPPTGPRGSHSVKDASSKTGLEIRGASGRPADLQKRESETPRRSSQSSVTGSQKPISGVPAKDPHTLEREARDRERLLKEAQRIAGMAGLANRSSGKRSRDLGDDRVGRNKSRRSEAVSNDEEERMRRIETEREGRRWD